MSQQNVPAALSRRGFLQTMGALTGAAFLPGLSPSARKAQAEPAPLAIPAKIGLLLPVSTRYPQLGANLTTGLRLGLAHATGGVDNGSIPLFVEEVGTTHRGLAATTNRLVAERGVDLIIGVATPSLAATLRPVLTASRTPFIALDAGANLPRASEQFPYMVYNTLGYWQANWAMGQWAASNLGLQAFIASSFYDSGYDALYAFRAGFEAAGGRINGTSITHVPSSSVDLPGLAAAIRQSQPDFVFGLYNGQISVDFLRAYTDTGLAAEIPLVGSAFLVDETTLPDTGATARGVRSTFSWAADLASPAHQTFTAAYHAATGKAPDAFALLGYDTAQLVVAALRASGEAGNGSRLAQALQSARWSSPRGLLQMDKTTQSCIPPLYLREARLSSSGWQNQLLNQLQAVRADAIGLSALRDQPRTGWVHAYPVA